MPLVANGDTVRYADVRGAIYNATVITAYESGAATILYGIGLPHQETCVPYSQTPQRGCWGRTCDDARWGEQRVLDERAVGD